MPDRENVITHLQIMHTWASFAIEKDLSFFNMAHMKSIVDWTDDALSLLKEQEAVEPYITGNGESFETAETWWYECGNCNKPIDLNDKFCRHCGQAVKWE